MALAQRAGQVVMDDRVGRPFINAPFNSGTDQNLFNELEPDQDATAVNGEGVTFRQSFASTVLSLSAKFGHPYTPAQAAALADFLLPDLLPYEDNGRNLRDDVMDISLSRLTNEGLTTDHVGPHTDYLDDYPYLGNPHCGDAHDRSWRRAFLRIAGTTSAVAAGTTILPAAGSLAWTGADVLRFRAVAGLPKPPLPAQASYMITGQVDLAAGSGVCHQALHAGRPDMRSAIQFPGLTRKIRITAVTTAGGVVHISGRVDGASPLRPSETRTVELSIDYTAGWVRATSSGMK